MNSLDCSCRNTTTICMEVFILHLYVARIFSNLRIVLLWDVSCFTCSLDFKSQLKKSSGLTTAHFQIGFRPSAITCCRPIAPWRFCKTIPLKSFYIRSPKCKKMLSTFVHRALLTVYAIKMRRHGLVFWKLGCYLIWVSMFHVQMYVI